MAHSEFLAFLSLWALWLAFGSYDMTWGLKEKAGIFPVKKVKVKEGGPISMRDVLLSFLFWGLAGYKLGLMIEDYGTFVQNPQEALLSTKGFCLMDAHRRCSWWRFFVIISIKNARIVRKRK